MLSNIEKNTGYNVNITPIPLEIKTVQEAYAGANFYDCDKAVVMTNITFTKSATQLAQKLDVELWPNCPVTLFTVYRFKIMSSLNAVAFSLRSARISLPET